MWLSPEQAQAIIAHARKDAPREACGMIIGRRGQSERASEIIPIANVADDPIHTYHMDDVALLKAFTRAEARGLEVVGLYHSHPAGEPIPSRTDIAQATYPDTPYLIVGLRDGAKLAAWTMRAGQVDEVPLHVGSEPPMQTGAANTRAQKNAILISAVIAFILVIVVSLSLLPPAPAH